MSFRGRGRGGYSSNNTYNRNSFSNQQQNVDAYVAANAYPIEIMGWNGASSQECINFISRKTRVIVTNSSVDQNTGILKGYVKNESQANELLNWSGVKFAGQTLKFSKGSSNLSNQLGGSSSSTGTSTIETITNFLKSRYQPEIKMLNLSNVKQDPNLNALGFFGSVSVSSKFFPALMKIASDLKIEVDSIDLSNNELQDLQALSSMAQTFPKLLNLSLQNNQFSKLKVFETWRHKLNFLRELILFNNPIVQTTNPQEIQNIKLELMKSFPKLVILNGEPLRNEQILLTNTTFPFENPQPMFFQDVDLQNLSTNFITNYLNLWDNNRADLMILYQNESQFSMQLDTAHPYLIEDSTNNANLDFGNYISNSRNLTRISSGKIRLNKVSIGQEQIFKSFQQLPKSKHELANKPNNFSMETYKFAPLNGVIITLHGSFDEVGQPEIIDTPPPSGPRNNTRFHHSSSNGNRGKKVALNRKSFDRTFLVLPGPNGSMIVASDLLLIRPYSSETPWNVSHQQPQAQPQSQSQPQPPQQPSIAQITTSATNASTPSPAPIPPTQQPIPPITASSTATISDIPPEIKTRFPQQQQQELIIKIINETRLNFEYTIMLLESSNWNYEISLNNFKNSMGSLPRDAFI
ncbi:MEX67 [Candida pseudojiufengensis]|uniref:MEX67 n=1 Tax=Candida pseudojiufengensis TaxID=497109 RepID=UPI0022258474|nr:MEX67 [Candida pseudojiufengensis]KAI5962428.1 MEX67 [Candida pseudojiufengensis]